MIFEKVCALIAEQFNVDADSITMDTSFEDDLNADSVDIVDLSMALEEEFDIDELTEEEARLIQTTYIAKLRQPAEFCLPVEPKNEEWF